MNPDLPLTEPQQRRLMVTLARLEQVVAQLLEATGQPGPKLRLTEFQNPLDEALGPRLGEPVTAALAEIRRMADDLGLPARKEFIRQQHSTRLQLALVDLFELRPSRGLRGCGVVAEPTAAYLDAALPRLETHVERLFNLVQPANPAPGATWNHREN